MQKLQLFLLTFRSAIHAELLQNNRCQGGKSSPDREQQNTGSSTSLTELIMVKQKGIDRNIASCCLIRTITIK